MTQINFCGAFNLDPKQSIIAQSQNINKKITNKNIKTTIHKGKNQNPKGIL